MPRDFASTEEGTCCFAAWTPRQHLLKRMAPTSTFVGLDLLLASSWSQILYVCVFALCKSLLCAVINKWRKACSMLGCWRPAEQFDNDSDPLRLGFGDSWKGSNLLEAIRWTTSSALRTCASLADSKHSPYIAFQVWASLHDSCACSCIYATQMHFFVLCWGTSPTPIVRFSSKAPQYTPRPCLPMARARVAPFPCDIDCPVPLFKILGCASDDNKCAHRTALNDMTELQPPASIVFVMCLQTDMVSVVRQYPLLDRFAEIQPKRLRNVVKHNMCTRHACEHHYCGDIGVDQNRPSHPCPQATSTGKGGSKVLKHG